MKQVTAVEYLVEQLKRIGFSTNNLIEFENEVIIAKAMEKEQIIDAYGDGLNAHRTNFCNREEYYNKIYKTI
jgi:hypothetical protein